jgi:secreted protein with Ig-like and vWFA domain
VGLLADTILGLWQEIDQALSPIVGSRGVAALYNRSLQLTTVAHPWLPSAASGVLAAIDLAALKAALLRQTAARAAAGGSALLETFRELLASLVGTALTERLLRSVWTPTSGASPAQDHSS